MMTLQRTSLFVILIFTLVFGFQNCSEPPVDLVSTPSYQSYSIMDISGKICLEQGFHLKSFFVTNLSMKPDANALLSDADRDGLSDSFERQHGFDPSEPRSRGSVLDGICFYLTQTNDCSDLNIRCDGRENELGFSDCDINALNLQLNNTSQLGLDSDDDGIPDKIEILFELDAAVDDASLDYDGDEITNKAEVLQSTHPRQKKSTTPQFADRLVTQKVAPQETDCAGEEWGFLSENQRIYNLGNQPTDNESLSNNHILIMALSEKPQSSLTVARKTQYIYLERNYEQPHEVLVYSSEDFQTADNNFFRQANQ